MAGDEITVTSTTDDPEAVAEALAEGTEPDTGKTSTLEEPGGDEDADAEGGADEGGASDTGEPTPKTRRRRGGQRSMQQRIDTLTWQVNRERAEREELQRQLLERERPPQQQAQQPVFEEPEPDINSYETLEEWQRDLSSWNRRFAKWEIQQELDARMANVITPEKIRASQIQQNFQASLNNYRETVPEFGELAQKMIDDGVPTTPLMNEHFLHSGEMGPQIMHWLALNPDECRRIAALPQGPQLVALGKIESKIEAGALSGRNGGGQRESAAAAAQVPISRQSNRNQSPPEPPNPVGARGGNASKNPDNMSYAEYRAWRRNNGAR